jgi:hypothetical protein
VKETVNHPSHYGGAENLYEAIKVIEAWNLGFCLGNAVKYILRAGKKGDACEDLKKGAWYLQREIEKREHQKLEERRLQARTRCPLEIQKRGLYSVRKGQRSDEIRQRSRPGNSTRNRKVSTRPRPKAR